MRVIVADLIDYPPAFPRIRGRSLSRSRSLSLGIIDDNAARARIFGRPRNNVRPTLDNDSGMLSTSFTAGNTNDRPPRISHSSFPLPPPSLPPSLARVSALPSVT